MTNAAAPGDYAGGETADDFGTYPDYDLDFELTIGPTPAPVPLLPGWGRGALALALLASAIGLARRKAGGN